ncbi:MAG: hypothetical protein IME92_09615 [Proteobacteria bacterium]|nr:hypothetical protein [Pseudomonadota bacterium]
MLRTLARLGLIIFAVFIVHQLIAWLMAEAEAARNGPLMIGLVLVVLFTYIILISIPFVPGIEIALSLMILRGPEVVIWIYGATVLGLFLSFLAGQYLSYGYLHTVFHDMRMKRACNLLDTIEPLSRSERLDLLKNKIPRVLRPFLIEGRYALIGVVLNIPGNALIGGGGGIMLVAGLSRLFSTCWVFVLLMVAVSPVPIAILVFGIDPMAFLRSD